MSNEINVQERIEQLKKRAERVHAIQEVENVFDKFLQYYNLQHKDGMMSCFALDEEDVSIEEAYSEVFQGKEKLAECFDCFKRLAGKKGVLLEQTAVCPVIEIAGDGETAKLVSFSRGLKGIDAADLQTYTAGRYYADFKKQADGSWKIWHLHWFVIFDTPVKVGFLNQSITNKQEWTIPEMEDVFTAVANKPSTYWPVVFNPNASYDYIPEAPEPYEHYDGMTDQKRTRYLHHMWDRTKY